MRAEKKEKALSRFWAGLELASAVIFAMSEVPNGWLAMQDWRALPCYIPSSLFLIALSS